MSFISHGDTTIEPATLTAETLREAMEMIKNAPLRVLTPVAHPRVYREVMADTTLTAEEKYMKIASHPSTFWEYLPLRS